MQTDNDSRPGKHALAFTVATVVFVLLLAAGVIYLVVTRQPDAISLPAAAPSTPSTDSAAPIRPSVKISNLTPNSELKYEIAEDLQVGDRQYTDRNYLFTRLPPQLRGLTWIRTANDDKLHGKLELRFNIDRESYLYILWVARDPAAQVWLQDHYTKLDEKVASTDEPLAIYKSNQPFPKGPVITSAASTENGMYIIAVEPAGNESTAPAPQSPPAGP